MRVPQNQGVRPSAATEAAIEASSPGVVVAMPKRRGRPCSSLAACSMAASPMPKAATRSGRAARSSSSPGLPKAATMMARPAWLSSPWAKPRPSRSTSCSAIFSPASSVIMAAPRSAVAPCSSTPGGRQARACLSISAVVCCEVLGLISRICMPAFMPCAPGQQRPRLQRQTPARHGIRRPRLPRWSGQRSRGQTARQSQR